MGSRQFHYVDSQNILTKQFAVLRRRTAPRKRSFNTMGRWKLGFALRFKLA